ncbi:Zeta toxin [Streptosporangium subroseum]|uniref:UDP-N-acetylglucosamine kinase n=1 Tax=Streptosporangium subroseum TaxID=106412 RepID=A0A239P0Z9_9ACTN|nr:zeta toxin family protein [Streptosporangium subroseum]SNT60298.1 Zeta toxin [Streptosporangium subroseum]
MAKSEEEKYALTPDENERIFHDIIVDQYLSRNLGPEEPRVWILGGQPGAGKSTLMQKIGNKTATEIGCDLFRIHHKEYERLQIENDETAAFYTNFDARIWTEKAARYLIEHRQSVIFDGTLSRELAALSLIKMFKAADYEVDVVFVATPSAVSLLSCLKRYVLGAGPEWVPSRIPRLDTYNHFYLGVLETARKIESESDVDSVRVFLRRDATWAYVNRQIEPGRWQNAQRIVNVLEGEQNRTWSRDETLKFLEDFKLLQDTLVGHDSKWEAWFREVEKKAEHLMAPGLEFPQLSHGQP